MYPFERFSTDAKRVLTIAQEEAERDRRSYIGTEHLLQGVLRVDDSPGARLLAELHIDLKRVRSTLATKRYRERNILRGTHPTSRVKKVIEVAFDEALRTDSSDVNSGHIVVGLLLEGDGAAGQVLKELGATLDKVRDLLGAPRPARPLHDLTIDELMRRALIEEQEDADGLDTAWEAIDELRHRGSPEIFDRAQGLIRSATPLERKLSLDVLGQLGLERPFREETVTILQGLLPTEDDPDVQAAALVAFGHLGDERGREHLLSYATHAAPELRRSVAWALPSCARRDEDGRSDDQEALATLMVLMGDSDDQVRDWATFAVGQFFDDDTPEVRTALAQRLTDPHDETREEAVLGLARRHDERAIAPLINLLRGSPGSGALETAEELADPRFVEALELAVENAREHLAGVQAALEACRRGTPT